jgi:ribonuclease R
MAKRQPKQTKWQRLDPYFSREKEKYGNPAPSREFIVDYLNERGMTLSWRALCAEWDLSDNEADALERRLKAMERDGELIRNRRLGYGVVAQMELI